MFKTLLKVFVNYLKIYMNNLIIKVLEIIAGDKAKIKVMSDRISALEVTVANIVNTPVVSAVVDLAGAEAKAVEVAAM